MVSSSVELHRNSGHHEKKALEFRIAELYKVLSMEIFDKKVTVNRIYKSEVVQLSDHCNLLSAQVRSLQDSISGKGLCPAFLLVQEFQNPPPSRQPEQTNKYV